MCADNLRIGSYIRLSKSLLFPSNPDCDLMFFKGNISCYILLLNSLLTFENTKFIAGEISLKVSLVLYIPIGHYKPDKGKNEGNKIT